MNKRLIRRTRSTLPGILANTDGGDAGGGAPAPPVAPAAPAAPAPAPAPAEAPAAPQQPAQEPAAEGWDGKVESLPEPVQKMIRDLRAESADRRTKLTAAEQAQQDAIRALAKAAGIELPGEAEAPKPEELAQQLTATQQAARESAAELIVWRNATTLGVDPGAVTDSRAFSKAIENLDPASSTFAADVQAAAKAAAEANPKLKAGRAPGASSIDTTAGGSGSRVPRSSKPVPLSQAVAGHYGTSA